MRVAERVVLIAALLISVSTAVEAWPILFLVRHAEKATTGGNDPARRNALSYRTESP